MKFLLLSALTSLVASAPIQNISSTDQGASIQATTTDESLAGNVPPPLPKQPFPIPSPDPYGGNGGTSHCDPPITQSCAPFRHDPKRGPYR
ncbi:hypothetical protein BT63DRAFT_481965 [Microthyrium microscopicum]|uniref:Uncharacterized protein n=1 Tax=Microthyrium microscopicum TaxID=703497 RepID=A0A6A6U3J6_9PEZI|nr:hypothetical protein BT63DRAFT_481965 [Microthyrium microscopicum]